MTVECRLLPHGGYTMLPAVFSTLGWLASLAQDGCDYARVSGEVVQKMTLDFAVPFLEVGFNAYREPSYDLATNTWRVEYGSSCLPYDDTLVPNDSVWKVAKGFQFLALVFGGGGALFLWFSSCFVFSPATWRWAGYEVFVASLCQTLAFLWFQTQLCKDNTCSMFFGAKSDIAASIFWFCAALLIFVRYPPPQLKDADDDDDDDDDDLDDDDLDDFENVDGMVGELDLPIAGDATAAMEPPLDQPRPTESNPNVVIPQSEIS